MKHKRYETARMLNGVGFCEKCHQPCSVYEVRGGEDYLAYDLLKSNCCDAGVTKGPGDGDLIVEKWDLSNPTCAQKPEDS